MTLAVSDEHLQLAETVRRWAERHAPADDVRAVAEAAGSWQETPAAAAGMWQALAEHGLLGLHLAEEFGGSGYGLVEAAVTAEALGHALVPGPIASTMLAGALIQRGGEDALRKELLPGLADGSRTAAVAVGAPALEVAAESDGIRVSGNAGAIVGAADADLLLLPLTPDEGRERLAVVAASELSITPQEAFDPTRSVAVVEANDLGLPADRILELTPGLTADLAAVLLGAESAGVAAWCLEVAVEYAKVREQFGRPIGQFQGVKHLCADMLVRVESARAAAWDAAEAAGDPDQLPLAAAVAASVAIDAAHTVALDAIQVLGGIGFTWEHDCHFWLRRATANRQIIGAPNAHRRRIAELALAGTRRTLELDLDADGDAAAAATHRDTVRTFLADLPDDERARREAIADAGYVNPHWPAPYGRDAGPIEQLVIDQEFSAAGVARPNLVIGGWILPSIIAHGTEEQKEQFVTPTLHGDITWCQMFSEPGAGSDLAAIQTKAEKVEGGWVLTGQKVWTSLAHKAQWSLCIARTNPDAPKHDGITAFLVDMASEGLDIRPLKELTGNALFNEIYLDGVFVPDELVIGAVDGGWKVARNTLANERVAMSKGSSMGSSVEGVVAAFAGLDDDRRDDPVLRDTLGRLVTEGQILGLLGFRTTLKQLGGLEPGAGSSVRKLIGGKHSIDCAEFTLELLGTEGLHKGGAGQMATYMFLQTQCLTIAGGTTNVQRNVVAERLLGLPRDPDPATDAAPGSSA